MKILLIQHSGFINGSGGTEKIACLLANHFAALGHDVEIATNQNISGGAVFPLTEGIKLTNIFSSDIVQENLKVLHNYTGKNPFQWVGFKIKKKRAKFSNKNLLKKMNGLDGLYEFNLKKRAEAWKKYIDTVNPDLIITMSIGSLLEITYQNQYTIPIINSVNGRPDYDYSDILWYRSEIEMSLLKESYKHLSAVQILFDSYNDFLPKTFTGKSVTISNPVPQFENDEIVDLTIIKDKYKILHIGTLATDCKQQHVAIDTFAEVVNEFPNWELYFWGVGNDFDLLNKKIKNYQLEDKIFLNGFTDHPVSKLKEADLFIFPSKYEGFGLALAEAMSVGLPGLGFATCSGVNELIKHNITGFLAQDTEELVLFLKRLMSDPDLRAEFGKNAHLEMKKFTPEEMLEKWSLLIEEFIS